MENKNNIPPTLPTSQQMYELRKIYGVDGARKILSDYYGIDLCRYKYGINPWEAQVIHKTNPNKNTRDNMICELADRGVSIELISLMSEFSRPTIYSIINYKNKSDHNE